MNSIEIKCLNYISKKRSLFFISIVTALAVVVRFSGKDYISGDMRDFLIPWFNYFRNSGGIKGLGTQIGDCSLLYQTMISLLSYVEINCIYLYKIVSCITDFILAYSAAFIAQKFFMDEKGLHNIGIMVYAVVLFMPTVIMDSAFWGQSDSIYALFCIWTVYYLYKSKYAKGFIFWGIAFSFKLQAIFLLPIIFILYVKRKQFSITNLGISLVVFLLSGSVAFLNGRKILAGFEIYFKQTEEYGMMYFNYPSFWMLVGNHYDSMKWFAVLLTVVLLGVLAYFVIDGRLFIDSPRDYLYICCVALWIVTLFLPSMHERYTYVLDLLLVILCVSNRRFIPMLLVEIVISTMTYGNFLFNNGVTGNVYAVINLFNLFVFLFFGIRGQLICEGQK